MSNNVKNLETTEEVFEEYHAQDRLEADIKRLEQDIEYAEMRLKRGAALKRLIVNEDYKEIFDNGYFKELANGAIKSLGKGRDSNVPKEDWMEILTSIGHLKTYLEGIEQFEGQAKSLLPQMKDDLVKLKAQNTVIN
jgi:hypothetical protein